MSQNHWEIFGPLLQGPMSFQILAKKHTGFCAMEFIQERPSSEAFYAEYWGCEFSHWLPKQRVLSKQEGVAAKCSSSLIIWQHKHRKSTSLSMHLSPGPLTDKRGDLTLLIWMGNYSTWALLQPGIIWNMLEEGKAMPILQNNYGETANGTGISL